jgi:hypothetical protein
MRLAVAPPGEVKTWDMERRIHPAEHGRPDYSRMNAAFLAKDSGFSPVMDLGKRHLVAIFIAILCCSFPARPGQRN